MSGGARSEEHRTCVVLERRQVAERVVELTLAAPEGEPALPGWTAGAHVELDLPSGLRRQYSLCGGPDRAGHWVVAVLEETEGRGGSAEVHRELHPGARLQVRVPRNDFPLVPAQHYLFVAGGIGITPLLAMAERAAADGADWRLVYVGRSRDTMAYRDRLAELEAERVELWPSQERGRPPIKELMATQKPGTLVYTCGPNPLLDAVAQAQGELPDLPPVRLERFAASGPVDLTGGAFEVVLARTGETVVVQEGTTVLAAVMEVLPDLSFSCEEGYCGDCQVKVLEGKPDHRDDYLQPHEQESSDLMMICVSRCVGPRIVLDL